MFCPFSALSDLSSFAIISLRKESVDCFALIVFMMSFGCYILFCDTSSWCRGLVWLFVFLCFFFVVVLFSSPEPLADGELS